MHRRRFPNNTVNATVPTTVTITTTADVNNVKPGQSVPIHADTGGDTSTSSGGSSSGGSSVATGEGGANAGGDAAAPAQTTQTQVSIVFQMFIDTVGDTPLIVSPNPDFDVTIPAMTSAGKHKLICRVAHSNGTTTDVMSSIDITVTSWVGPWRSTGRAQAGARLRLRHPEASPRRFVVDDASRRQKCMRDRD